MTATIQFGERAKSEAANAKAKTYYHVTPGANFIMPTGLIVQFLGGRFDTTDPEIQMELDKVCDRASSQIYTKASLPVEIAAANANLANEAAANTVAAAAVVK